MNNKFVLEMDKIEPGRELLQNTINLIRQKELNKNMKKYNSNKLLITITTLLGLTTTCFAGYEILSKRFKSTDMMGISIETESDEKFEEFFSEGYSSVYNENNEIVVYKDKVSDYSMKDAINILQNNYKFDNITESSYRTLKSGIYGFYIEGNLSREHRESTNKEYFIGFVTEQNEETISIEIYINAEANNFKEIYEADIKMINSLKIDEELEQYYKNKYEEITFNDIKLKVNSRWNYEQIKDNNYHINSPVFNEEASIVEIEIYNAENSLEEFYNDDVVLESVGAYYCSFNEKHEYVYDLYGEEDSVITIPVEKVKEIIKDKYKYADKYDYINIIEGFKLTSKNNIQKDRIKGIRYTYSYPEGDRETVIKIYILGINNKIYKFKVYNENEETQKIINSITLAEKK